MKPKTDDSGFNDTSHREDAHIDSELLSRSISYHPGVSESFEFWAESCGFQPETLRQVTESAIRNRHHESIRRDACFKHQSDAADIYRLSLGTVNLLLHRTQRSRGSWLWLGNHGRAP